MQTGRNKTTNDRPQFRLTRGLVFLIAFFFCFLSVFGKADASANDHLFGDNLQENLHNLPKADLFFDSAPLPRFPFESAPVPCEPNPTDKEGEATDDLDDGPDKFFSRSSLKQRIAIVAAKRKLSQQSLSSANNKRVPLFILHHSWKTFLSDFHAFSIGS